MITVEDVMTRDPVTLSRFNSLADARKPMNEKRFRHIPIVNEHKELIGLVTQRNVFQHGVSSQTFMDENELSQIETGTLLSDVMTTHLTTVSPTQNIRHAAQLVFKNKFDCLPVIDDDGKLLGIITDHDFVEMTLHLLELMDEKEPIELDD